MDNVINRIKGSNLGPLTMLNLFSHNYCSFNLKYLLLSVDYCNHISLPKSDPLSGAHIVYFLNSLKTVKVFKYFISFPNFIKPWALTYNIILGGGGRSDLSDWNCAGHFRYKQIIKMEFFSIFSFQMPHFGLTRFLFSFFLALSSSESNESWYPGKGNGKNLLKFD
jgi:hypothetical protein